MFASGDEFNGPNIFRVVRPAGFRRDWFRHTLYPSAGCSKAVKSFFEIFNHTVVPYIVYFMLVLFLLVLLRPLLLRRVVEPFRVRVCCGYYISIWFFLWW